MQDAICGPSIKIEASWNKSNIIEEWHEEIDTALAPVRFQILKRPILELLPCQIYPKDEGVFYYLTMNLNCIDQ